MEDIENTLNNYDEMGTTIDKIKNPGRESQPNKELFRDIFKDKEVTTCSNSGNKKFNVTNFVQDLEKNLDNFDDIGGPLPANTDFHQKKETFVDTIVKEEKPKTVKPVESSFDIYTFLINIKEPLIIVLLFVLLNNIDLIALVYKIPYINGFQSHYPSLILRGIILATIIFYLRKLETN